MARQLHWPIRRRSRFARHTGLIAIGLISMASLAVGVLLTLFVSGFFAAEPTIDISQEEIDKAFTQFTDDFIVQRESTAFVNSESASRPDLTRFCDQLARVADGKSPRGPDFGAWPSQPVAQRFVDEVCSQ